MATLAVAGSWPPAGSLKLLRSLAPAAIALIAGIIAGRVLVLWSHLRLGLARRAGNIPAILASAQLARRPGSARMVVVLTSRWRCSHSPPPHGTWLSGPATTTRATVRRGNGLSGRGRSPRRALVAAVEAADPSGRAMAVVRTDEQYAQGKVELIGIQSELFSTVAVWRGHDKAQLAAIADKLRGQGGEEGAGRCGHRRAGHLLRARRVCAALRRAGLGAGPAPDGHRLGDVKAGLKDYTGAVDRMRASNRLPPGRFRARPHGGLGRTIRATAVMHEVAFGSGRDRAADGRRERLEGGDRSNPAARDQFNGRPPTGSRPRWNPAGRATLSSPIWTLRPPCLPSSPGARRARRTPGHVRLPRPRRCAARVFGGTACRAPRSRAGAHGACCSTSTSRCGWPRRPGSPTPPTFATRSGPPPTPRPTSTANWPTREYASADPDHRKRAEQLGRKAPALGFRLFLLAGVAAAGLALGVLLLGWRLGAGERRAELAALRATGLRARVLRRALRRERLASLVLPLVVGLAAGLGSAC